MRREHGKLMISTELGFEFVHLIGEGVPSEGAMISIHKDDIEMLIEWLAAAKKELEDKNEVGGFTTAGKVAKDILKKLDGGKNA